MPLPVGEDLQEPAARGEAVREGPKGSAPRSSSTQSMEERGRDTEKLILVSGRLAARRWLSFFCAFFFCAFFFFFAFLLARCFASSSSSSLPDLDSSSSPSLLSPSPLSSSLSS